MQKLIPIPQPAATRFKPAQPVIDGERGDYLFLVSTDDTTVGEIRVDVYAMESSAGWQLIAVCPTGSNLNIQSVLSEAQKLELEAWCNLHIPAPTYLRAA